MGRFGNSIPVHVRVVYQPLRSAPAFLGSKTTYNENAAIIIVIC